MFKEGGEKNCNFFLSYREGMTHLTHDVLHYCRQRSNAISRKYLRAKNSLYGDSRGNKKHFAVNLCVKVSTYKTH